MIECQDVSFSYPASTLPDSERQVGGALKHISCTIEDGSFVLLCRTSGCGKTTMTRLFNGLIPHYHEGTYTGSVYLDGKDTRDLSLFDISLKVGSVFQNPRSQFFNVDTTSELAFGPENHGMPEDIVRDRVKRVAAQLSNRQISRRIKKHLWLSNRSWARDVHSFGILHSWGALAGKSCSAQASSIWLIAGAFRRTQSK